ncbi:MAG: hypothetical protein ACOCRO_09260 [Halanaerobiales bacterium]
MVLGIIGWVIVGALLAGAIAMFWDDIKNWLNNTAADAVERVLGYDARRNMHRAVARIDRVVDTIRNRTVVYTKRNHLDTYYDKVTLSAEAAPYEIDNDVLKKLRQEGELIQKFEYRG